MKSDPFMSRPSRSDFRPPARHPQSETPSRREMRPARLAPHGIPCAFIQTSPWFNLHSFRLRMRFASASCVIPVTDYSLSRACRFILAENRFASKRTPSARRHKPPTRCSVARQINESASIYPDHLHLPSWWIQRLARLLIAAANA